MDMKSPIVSKKYAAYQAGAASLRALEAKNQFNVGFQLRATRPLGGSGEDSDERIGFVANKTLYNGGLLDKELEGARAIFEANVAQIKDAYRESTVTIETALQNIESMDKAIVLALKNAKLIKDEIVYLRQQLVIGGSTLESVLSAEARLFDAESKEVGFVANKQKSELTIVSVLGLLERPLGLE